MKILIIGERYSANLGDPIICESVEYLIKEEDDKVEIDFLDLSGRDSFDDLNGSIRKARFSRMKKVISSSLTKVGIDSDYFAFKRYHEKNNAYFRERINHGDYDLAIFAGGQMFLDYFVFPIQTIVEYLKAKNIPVIFNACGSGDIASRKMRKILTRTLLQDNVKFISTRDDLQSIKSLLGDINKEVVKTYDPALWASEVYGETKEKSDLIGLGVMFVYNMSYKKTLAFWIGIIRALNEKNIEWKIFCNGAPHDYEFALDVLRKMNYEEENLRKYIIEAPKRPEDLPSIIASFKGIISFRLHSHVIACSLAVPSIAIDWDMKLRYFFENINLAERVFEIDSDPTTLILALEEAMLKAYDEKFINSQKNSLRDRLIEHAFKRS